MCRNWYIQNLVSTSLVSSIACHFRKEKYTDCNYMQKQQILKMTPETEGDACPFFLTHLVACCSPGHKPKIHNQDKKCDQ